MENFKKLKVWEKAHLFVLDIYKISEQFPKEELFGIVSQIRRAAISVVANIVEGSKRKTNKDRRHFLVMADTSLEEVKYYIILVKDLGYIDERAADKITEQAREIGRMLTGLSKTLS